MQRALRFGLGIVFAVALVAGPAAYARIQRSHFRNLRVVTPGVLYRSGQLDKEGLKTVLYDYGIRTVITLREDDHMEGRQENWEEEFLAEHFVGHVRIPIGGWEGEAGEAPPVAASVDRFLEVMRNPEQYPQPVLLHCFAGSHRTGGMCAIYRMEFNRWPAERALEETVDCGYTNLYKEDDIREFLLNYQPAWKRRSGQEE